MPTPESETLVGGLKQRLDHLVSGEDRSVRTLVNELRELVVTYVKQETVDPLQRLGRYVLWGLIGSIFLAIGVVLLVLAAVRVLQAETRPHLTGSLTWVPYVGGLLLAAVVIGLTASRIGRRH
ncbi:MAG: hypothetical protein J2P58_01870 [Acidimicrobiaceae bacterium]|nr:hypothetical protein [Acidimicrobiaceae bacterium]MBO0746959.1 hypothetical protein [Acidimicrobiaceae bacterium]